MFHTSKEAMKKREATKKARIGLEPMNNGFANRPLNHLGIAPTNDI
jgi:uncharacterized protein